MWSTTAPATPNVDPVAANGDEKSLVSAQRSSRPDGSHFRLCSRWSHALPLDLLESVLKFADATDCCRVQLVCRNWKLSEAAGDRLWKRYFLAKWEDGASSDISLVNLTRWRQTYIQRCTIARNWMTGRYALSSIECSPTETVALVPGTALLLQLHTGRQTLECRDASSNGMSLGQAELKEPMKWLTVSRHMVFLKSQTPARDPVTGADTLEISSVSLPDLKSVHHLGRIAAAVGGAVTDGKQLILYGHQQHPLQLTFWDCGTGKCVCAVDSGGGKLRADWRNDRLYVALGSIKRVEIWQMSTKMLLSVNYLANEFDRFQIDTQRSRVLCTGKRREKQTGKICCCGRVLSAYAVQDDKIESAPMQGQPTWTLGRGLLVDEQKIMPFFDGHVVSGGGPVFRAYSAASLQPLRVFHVPLGYPWPLTVCRVRADPLRAFCWLKGQPVVFVIDFTKP